MKSDHESNIRQHDLKCILDTSIILYCEKPRSNEIILIDHNERSFVPAKTSITLAVFIDTSSMQCQ